MLKTARIADLAKAEIGGELAAHRGKPLSAGCIPLSWRCFFLLTPYSFKGIKSTVIFYKIVGNFLDFPVMRVRAPSAAARRPDANGKAGQPKMGCPALFIRPKKADMSDIFGRDVR